MYDDVMLAALCKLIRLTNFSQFINLIYTFFFNHLKKHSHYFKIDEECKNYLINYVVIFHNKQHREDFNGISQVERVKYVQRVRNIFFVHSYQPSIIKTRLPHGFTESSKGLT